MLDTYGRPDTTLRIYGEPTEMRQSRSSFLPSMPRGLPIGRTGVVRYGRDATLVSQSKRFDPSNYGYAGRYSYLNQPRGSATFSDHHQSELPAEKHCFCDNNNDVFMTGGNSLPSRSRVTRSRTSGAFGTPCSTGEPQGVNPLAITEVCQSVFDSSAIELRLENLREETQPIHGVIEKYMQDLQSINEARHLIQLS